MNSYSKEITLRSKSVIVGNVETTNIKIKLKNDHHIDISIEGGVESATENIVEFKVINSVFFNSQNVALTSLYNLFAINSDEIVCPKLMISDETWTELFTHIGIVEGISFEQNEMPTSSLC